jgi:ABC-type branched-subunit amino acid transport system ATPase component
MSSPARTAPACTRTSARTTSCTAWTSRCPRARSRCCWAATAPARPPRCAPSWACGSLAGQHPLQRARHHRPGHARHRRLGIAYVPENMGIFTDLTVQENMLLAARGAQRTRAGPRAAGLDLRPVPGAAEVLALPGRQAQGGQKQMLAVARAIVEPRALLLIDEPSKGLAPSIIQNLIDAFARAQAPADDHPAGGAELHDGQGLGDTVAVMDNGRVVHRGSMAELAADEALQQRLLGLSLGAHQ